MKRVRAGAVDLLVATDVAARGLDVERHIATEQRAEVAQHDMRVGDRGLDATASVTRGAWDRAGRSGPHLQPAAGVAKGDGSAARADRVDRCHRRGGDFEAALAIEHSLVLYSRDTHFDLIPSIPRLA